MFNLPEYKRLIDKVMGRLHPPGQLRLNGVSACWLPENDVLPSYMPGAFTDLALQGTILRLFYKSRSGTPRATLVEVVGKRRPIGPGKCALQLTQSSFRVLENLSVGSIQVTVASIP